MMDKYPIKGQTISSLELKCELVVDGIRLHPSAQEGVGTQYKEQVHCLFDFACALCMKVCPAGQVEG